MATSKKLAPVVSVLNMKGGVGKTTISAHVFRHLYLRLQKSTLVIDFDPQFNLTQTVLTEKEYEKFKAASQTILSVMEPQETQSIFKVTTKVGPPPKEQDICIQRKMIAGHPEINLSIIAGDFGLVKYSLVDDQKSLIPIRQRFLQFVEESRATRDLVCIDCNPSSSFMTLCAVLASTHILVPVRPDRYSILGLALLDEFLDQVPLLATKPKIIVMLNGVPTSGYDPTVENSLRSHPKFGALTMLKGLEISRILQASPTYTGYATDKKVPHRWTLTNKMSAVVDELGEKLGLK